MGKKKEGEVGEKVNRRRGREKKTHKKHWKSVWLPAEKKQRKQHSRETIATTNVCISRSK